MRESQVLVVVYMTKFCDDDDVDVDSLYPCLHIRKMLFLYKR